MKGCYLTLMCMVFTLTSLTDGILASMYQSDNVVEILKNIKKSVFIDAGYTGSRAYIYDVSVDIKPNYPSVNDYNFHVRPHIPYKTFKVNDCVLRLLQKNTYPITNRRDIVIMPPLSPIIRHFRKILEFINNNIQFKERKFTPIFFMGTAGFRTMHEDECEYFVNQLKLLISHFFSRYLVHNDYSVRVLSGFEEGIYSFVTVQELLYIQSKDIGKSVEFKLSALNYKDYDDRLLHISGYNSHHLFKYASIIEIGGGSMQIVSPLPNALIRGDCANDLFYRESTGLLKSSKYILDDNIYRVHYDSRIIHLFAKSYLGLGKQLSLLHYLHMVFNETPGDYGDAACLPVGFRALLPEMSSLELTIELKEIISEKFDMYGNIRPYVIGTGNPDKCIKQIDALLNKLVDVKIPFVIPDNVSIIGLENIFYTLKPVDGRNFHDHTSAEILQELGRKFCPRSILELESHFIDGTDWEKVQTLCFTLNLFAKILTNVLSLDEKRVIYPKHRILGHPLTWTLGSAILDIPNFIDKSMEELDKRYVPQYYSLALYYAAIHGGVGMQHKMDDRWSTYRDAIKSSTELPRGMENTDYTKGYNNDQYMNESHAVNSMGNPVGNSTGLVTDSSIYSISNRELSFNSPNNYENYNYKMPANPVSKNNYKSDLNSMHMLNDQVQYPFFGQPFNNNSWITEYDPLLSINPVNSHKANGKNNYIPTATSHSSIGGETTQDWKFPEPTSPIQDNSFMGNTIKREKVDLNVPFSSANYVESSESDFKCTNTGMAASEFSFDRSSYSKNRNCEAMAGEYNDGVLFRWDFLIKSSTEVEKIESFKHLISISSESEIPSIITYLLQLISMRSSYRIFALKALTITLASHPEIFTSSFQPNYVEKLFIHPTLDDLACSFLRLLLSNMANIKTNDKSTNYPETVKTYISKILQICFNRSECNDVNLLGSSRLRDWICTFWYEMPFSYQGIDIAQVCLSWINNRYDSLYMKDGAFALLVRERDSRGPQGLPWLFENFIKIAFKHSSNLSVDFQHVILMCGVKNANSKRVSYYECVSLYFTRYKSKLQNEKDLFLTYFSHILDVWIALLCIPWSPRHPNTPHLQMLSHFFQFIVQEGSINHGPMPQFLLIRAAICIAISRIASTINAEDASLQVISLILSGNKPFIHEQIAPQVLCGISSFIRRRLFLWKNVDSGISNQTIQTVQTLYDLISQVASVESNDNDDFEALSRLAPNLHHQPLFPRSNMYNTDHETNEELSNDIIDHLSTSRESENDGFNRLKMFLRLNENMNMADVSPRTKSSQNTPVNQREKSQKNQTHIEPLIPPPGLKNLGNTCYFNSVLQALYHTDDFLAALFSCQDFPESKNMNSAVCKGLQKLFKKMLTSGKDPVNPSSSYKMLPLHFKNKCQHDATEVARYLLAELGCDKLSIWKGLFVGLVIQRIKCKCGYVSDTNQTIIDFSFALASVDDEASIQSLMDGFMKKEKLSGENKYFCNRCSKNRKAEKWNVIASPPIHLMIILNRNQWEIDSRGQGSPEKILKHVHVNQMLSLCGFTYYLYGSIIHQGYSTDSGHYYFVGTRSDTVRYPETWYKMDDTNSTRIGPDYIDELSSDPSNTHVPYVLFYRCGQADRSPNIYV